VKKRARRTPRGYDGTDVTSRQMRDLLPKILEQVSEHYSDRPDLILASWPQIIGPKLAPMTRAVSFCEGALTVVVNNSTLYSLLDQHEKGKLLTLLRKRFPQTEIRHINFRIG